MTIIPLIFQMYPLLSSMKVKVLILLSSFVSQSFPVPVNTIMKRSAATPDPDNSFLSYDYDQHYDDHLYTPGTDYQDNFRY